MPGPGLELELDHLRCINDSASALKTPRAAASSSDVARRGFEFRDAPLSKAAFASCASAFSSSLARRASGPARPRRRYRADALLRRRGRNELWRGARFQRLLQTLGALGRQPAKPFPPKSYGRGARFCRRGRRSSPSAGSRPSASALTGAREPTASASAQRSISRARASKRSRALRTRP